MQKLVTLLRVGTSSTGPGVCRVVPGWLGFAPAGLCTPWLRAGAAVHPALLSVAGASGKGSRPLEPGGACPELLPYCPGHWPLNLSSPGYTPHDLVLRPAWSHRPKQAAVSWAAGSGGSVAAWTESFTEEKPGLGPPDTKVGSLLLLGLSSHSPSALCLRRKSPVQVTLHKLVLGSLAPHA